MRGLATALMMIVGGVNAQDLVFSPTATEACLAAVEVETQRVACIGASANACMSDTPGGETTVGMGGCLDRELQYWDARLNASYKKQMAQAKAIDAEMADLGATVPSQADALREMQRAWIPYRDAKCSYSYSQWGGGSGGGPAFLSCMMSETAEQALYLEHEGLFD